MDNRSKWIALMWRFLYFTVLISFLYLLLSSCTPKQRLDRLLYRHPYLGKTEWKDTTITDTVTFISKRVAVDTVSHIRDTLIIEKERLRTKVIVHKDSMFVFTESKEEKQKKIITRVIPVPITVFEHTDPPLKKKIPWWVWVGGILIFLIIVAVVALLFFFNLFKR